MTKNFLLNIWLLLLLAAHSRTTAQNPCPGDQTPPTAVCTEFTSISLSPGGSATIFAETFDDGSFDDCSAVRFSFTTCPDDDEYSFTCSDVTNGNPIVLPMYVTDAAGNQNVCLVSVEIQDKVGVCPAAGADCITCPNDTIISCDEFADIVANGLIPNFGEPILGQDCSSIYLFQSKFLTSCHQIEKVWRGEDASGVALMVCRQLITSESSAPKSMTGKIFLDANQNCQLDGGEDFVENWYVEITSQPSGNSVTVATNSNGEYSGDLNILSTDTSLTYNLLGLSGLPQPCAGTFSLGAFSCDTPGVVRDLPMYLSPSCLVGEVSVHAVRLRRCFNNNPVTVRYCNPSLQTIPNASLQLTLDPLLSIVSSNIPIASQTSNTYTFDLGDLPPAQCGDLQMMLEVSCNALLGQTHCIEAHLYPDDPCAPTSQWNGANIETEAICDGDSIRLRVKNTGTGDMLEEKTYIAVEDVIMYRSSPFQLSVGESIELVMPKDGSTWRIETEQVSHHPWPNHPSSTIEGCGGLNIPGLVTLFSLGDDPPYLDEECLQNTGSFDPNDKSAVPQGVGNQHFITANTDLEYLIRFQNTGTDTAFNVVIVDTLSAHLQWQSLRSGAASHPFKTQLFDGGVVKFIFENILLPDSNVNEAASHGFVKFSIRQQPDLPDGTRLENRAGIYFDFNDPIITNTVFHTIGTDFLPVSVHPGPNAPAGVSLSVAPNPVSTEAVFKIEGTNVREGIFQLFDGRGSLLRSQNFQSNAFIFRKNDLPEGVYFFKILADGGHLLGGNLMLR